MGAILAVCIGGILWLKPKDEALDTTAPLPQIASSPVLTASVPQTQTTLTASIPKATSTTKDFNALVYGENAKTTSDIASSVSGVNEDGSTNQNAIAYNDPVSDPRIKPINPEKDTANQLVDTTASTPAKITVVN